MNITQHLSISYYKTIATLNNEHQIFLVQHRETGKIYVKKILEVYNADIYYHLISNPIPGTPKIREICEENQKLILIEDYISGTSLSEIMIANSLDIKSFYCYICDLCSILEAMHSSFPPIIHRDIKPSNILITEYNRAVLLDFNAAKYYSKETDSDTILLGTPGYAAPEQYGYGSSSPKTDIYALGILMKELSNCVSTPPKELFPIIDKCVQLNPKDRFASVTELKTALEELINPTFKPAMEKSLWTYYLFPGYRSLTPWKMLVATPFYCMLLTLSFTLEVENANLISLWIERVFTLLVFLSIIFTCFNYLDIQRFFPLCKHNNKIIRCFGIFLQGFIILFFLLLTMCFTLLLFQA